MNISLTKVFLFIAVVSAIVGALSVTKTLSQIDKKIADSKEMARPANVSLTKITVLGCADCFNVDEAVAIFKKQNVSVGEEKTLIFNTPEANAIVSQLGVKRLPTYIVTGEASKKSLEGFVNNNGEIKNNTFVFTKVTPLFIDSESKKQIGKVTVTYLTDNSCAQCIGSKHTVDAFKKVGVKISEEKEVAWNSVKGQEIINKYKIIKLPTFLLSSDISYYPSVSDIWPKFGTKETDGTYVARQIPLPYRDLEKRKIVGLVDVIYLIDSTCSDCYKAQEVHKDILTKGFGVVVRSERTVDINTPFGKELVNKYKITQVPTVLISPEVSEYVNLKSIWNQIGTVESNDWYVFRQSTKLGGMIYKDLTSNEIIRPQQQP